MIINMKRFAKALPLVGVCLLLILLASCKGPGGGKETTTPGGSAEHTHEYVEAVFPPTCRAEGYTLHTCLHCDHYYTDAPVAKLPHSYTDEVIAPTCTAEGYTKHTCSVCGDSYTDTPTEKREHVFEDEIIAPTCTEEGYTKHTCYLCHESYNDTPTPPIGHYYLPEVVRPTGTEQGYTLHKCIRCDDSYKDTYTEPISRSIIVNFDAAGGIMPEEPRVVYIYQTGEQVTLPVPTKEGSIFNGWYLETDEGMVPVSDGVWSIAEDIWLRADWSTIEVKYELKMGEGGDSFGYAHPVLSWGSPITNLPTATPLFGYLFDGYYDGDTRITSDTVSYYTEDVTFEARFLPPLKSGHVTGDNNHAEYDWALCADGILRFRVIPVTEGKQKSFVIADNMFRGLAGLIGVELPDTLTDIGNYAFADCPDLKTVTVPGSVGVIRSSVFEGSAALESVVLGSGISVINEDAFKGCAALTTLTLPKSLFQIYSPFDGCTSLREILYEGTAFQWSVIVKDPAAATTLGSSALQYHYEVSLTAE